MTSELGGLVATANYVGYLAGAMAGIFLPRLLHSKVALRISLVVVVVTLAGIPATEDGTAWFMLRLIAGISSALVFTIAVSSMLTHLRAHGRHFVGWAFGEVGAGIALSGILVLIVRAVSNWSTACIASAVLAAVLSAPAWTLKTQQPAAQQDGFVKPNYPRANRWFSAVLVSYALEGIGYIIAGTFLVAAIDHPAMDGSGAHPGSSSASRRCHPPRYGLGLQTATPAVIPARSTRRAIDRHLFARALRGNRARDHLALLFGATFLGLGTIALAIGAHLQFPRAVALRTTGYSAGQMLGPLLVTPLLN